MDGVSAYDRQCGISGVVEKREDGLGNVLERMERLELTHSARSLTTCYTVVVVLTPAAEKRLSRKRVANAVSASFASR